MKIFITMSVIAFISVAAQCGSINWSVAVNTLTRTIDGFTGNALSTTARNNIEVYLVFAENLQTSTDAYGSASFGSLVLGSQTTSNNGGLIDPNQIDDDTNMIMVEGTTRNFAAIAFITIDASNENSFFGTGGGGTAGLIPQDDWSKYYGTYYTWIGIQEQYIGPASGPSLVQFSAALNNNMTGGWVMIPEPATAGLALAGLALLFRRKRK